MQLILNLYFYLCCVLQQSSLLSETLTRRREKLHAYGLHMQPVIVIVGSLSPPEDSFVTVDVCFKSFHVLHASYPSDSMVWLPLQQLVYDIKTKWDTKSATVAAAISDLSVSI
jgi:hypothetical protein